MKIGAWVHTMDEFPLDEQLVLLAKCGLRSVRSYSIDYAEKAAPILQREGLSLLGGIHVDSAELVRDWRSQLRLEELERFHQLGVELEAICVGNELREGGDEPEKKRFTARLAFGLANLIDAYRQWTKDHGYSTRFTYAMEGIVLDQTDQFYEWVLPLIDACDIVSLNAYPMGNDAWFTFGAFEVSRRFLTEARARHDRLSAYETMLRRVLTQLERLGKPALLSETGFPSAMGYRIEGNQLVIPQTDGALYGEAMTEFLTLIGRINREYNNRIEAIYFYEWRDNFYHNKIWNVEQSPIHTAFGLCERDGTPKFDIARLIPLL